MKRIAGVVFGFLLALGGVVPSASAAIFALGELNDVFYTNREILVDAAGIPKDPTVTPLAVGDHLIGILNIQSIEGVISGVQFDQDPFPAGGIDQISGVFGQTILAIIPGGGPAAEMLLILGNPTLASFTDPTTFGVVPLVGGAGPLTAGEMFRFFHDTGAGTPFEQNGTVTDDIGKAIDGAFFLSYGLDATNGLGGDGFPATIDDTGYVYSLLTTLTTGEQFAGVDLVSNGSGVLFSPLADPNETFFSAFRGGPVFNDLVFHSTFALNAAFPANSPWRFSSNDPGQVQPFIPEVSSLWLLGMGLSGFGFLRRKNFLG